LSSWRNWRRRKTPDAGDGCDYAAAVERQHEAGGDGDFSSQVRSLDYLIHLFHPSVLLRDRDDSMIDCWTSWLANLQTEIGKADLMAGTSSFSYSSRVCVSSSSNGSVFLTTLSE